jgi:transposase InsO family protein
MIDSTHALTIKRQGQLAGISRGSLYYRPKSVSAADLAPMRRIDELHLEHPSIGARMLRDQLNRASSAITLEACHAVNVLQEAFNRHGTPEIVNTDQGSQFNVEEFVNAVEDWGCLLSMDGRGAWRDNAFIERLWKSVKYERVYLYAYNSVNEPWRSIMHYLDWYNRSRPHSQLGRKTPDEVVCCEAVDN